MGTVWRTRGAHVTILEVLDSFLPAADDAIAKEAWKIFTKDQGLAIVLGASIGNVAIGNKGATVEYATTAAGEQKLECDRLIVSIGRIPNTTGLGADTVGLKLDSRGFLEVDEDCRTNLPRVWGISDVLRES